MVPELLGSSLSRGHAALLLSWGDSPVTPGRASPDVSGAFDEPGGFAVVLLVARPQTAIRLSEGAAALQIPLVQSLLRQQAWIFASTPDLPFSTAQDLCPVARSPVLIVLGLSYRQGNEGLWVCTGQWSVG